MSITMAAHANKQSMQPQQHIQSQQPCMAYRIASEGACRTYLFAAIADCMCLDNHVCASG